MAEKQKRRKNNKFNYIIITLIVLALITLTGLFCCIGIANSLNKENSDLKAKLETSTNENNELVEKYKDSYTAYEVSEMIANASSNAATEENKKIRGFIKDTMSTKEGNTSELLRSLFPEYVVYKSNDGYTFANINPSIPANPYSNDDIIQNENGEMEYVPGGVPHYIKCIDVSQHQGKIDWEKVAENEIDYAIIRVGIRGYGSGKLVLDEQFEANVTGAITNGIDVGVYFFSQATSEEEAKEEAAFVLEAIAPYKITYPVAIDIEKLEDNSARGNLISREERTLYTDIFCKAIAEEGYKPMIYGNTYSLFEMLDMEKLYQYDVWFAFYDKYVYYPYMLNTWQYTDSLSIPGITGKVDGSITFVD